MAKAKKTPKAKTDRLAEHEVYDRAAMLFEMFCEHIGRHEVVQADPALKGWAARTADALEDFYQVAADRLTR